MKSVSLSWRILTGLLLSCVISASPGYGEPDEKLPLPSPSERRFTIQVGTYASYGQSLRQFMDLSRKLDADVLEDMRIERLERYYVVRLSSHANIEDTYRKLAAVRETVTDAFAMNESPETHRQTVYLYPDVSATLDAYILVLSRHPDREKALAALRKLKERLPAELHSRLYLERQGERFLVSLGGFDDFVTARTVQFRLVSLLEKRADLRGRKPGEGTQRVSVDELEEKNETEAAAVSGKPVPVPEPVQPFEAEEIVKPLETIDATMNDYLDEKDYGKALEVIRRAVERYPDNPDLYAWYGTVYMEMNRPDKALEHYQKAAELAPAVPEYQSNIGYGYLHMQQASARESINAFNRALTLEPDNSDALEGLGSIYVSIGRKDLAVGIHEELKLLDPVAARRLQELIRYGIAIDEPQE